MNKINNKVFWLTRGNYDIPESEEWENVQCVIVNCLNLSFENAVDYILKIFSEKKPDRYVIVTDTVDKEELNLLNNKFLSNNIIGIKKYNKDKMVKQINWILSDFNKENKMEDNIWFVSDTHFNHSNIIKYCNRPWNHGKDSKGELVVTEDDVKNMNEDMIKNWNSVIGKNDIVWHLGDFCLGKNQNENIRNLVSRLNGKINLVMGNHDNHNLRFYYDAGFHRVYDRKIIINDFVVLSHAPLEFVKGPFYNIYGHIHDCETYKTWSKDSCCVCVERHNYTPVSFKEIMRHYKELNSED